MDYSAGKCAVVRTRVDYLFNCSNLDITNTFYSSNNTITRITLYYKFLAFCTKYVQLSCITAENDLHVSDVWLLTSCKLTSVFLVTWTFLRGRIASMYQILCKYIHPLWSYHVMKFSIAVACLYNCKEYFFVFCACFLCMNMTNFIISPPMLPIYC